MIEETRVAFKRVFCKHTYDFHAHVGGDINNYQKVLFRSAWVCSKCGKLVLSTTPKKVDKND